MTGAGDGGGGLGAGAGDGGGGLGGGAGDGVRGADICRGGGGGAWGGGGGHCLYVRNIIRCRRSLAVVAVTCTSNLVALQLPSM